MWIKKLIGGILLFKTNIEGALSNVVEHQSSFGVSTLIPSSGITLIKNSNNGSRSGIIKKISLQNHHCFQALFVIHNACNV